MAYPAVLISISNFIITLSVAPKQLFQTFLFQQKIQIGVRGREGRQRRVVIGRHMGWDERTGNKVIKISRKKKEGETEKKKQLITHELRGQLRLILVANVW